MQPKPVRVQRGIRRKSATPNPEPSETALTPVEEINGLPENNRDLGQQTGMHHQTIRPRCRQ